VHWLVWPVWTLVGVQETLTEVMVGDTGGVLPPRRRKQRQTAVEHPEKVH
jgi:phage-related tail fiber protein